MSSKQTEEIVLFSLVFEWFEFSLPHLIYLLARF